MTPPDALPRRSTSDPDFPDHRETMLSSLAKDTPLHLDESSMLFLWQAGHATGISECLIEMGAEEDDAAREAARLTAEALADAGFADSVVAQLTAGLRAFQATYERGEYA